MRRRSARPLRRILKTVSTRNRRRLPGPLGVRSRGRHSLRRFDFLDKDKNGRIDIDEFRSAASGGSTQIDTDRDGRIDVREWGKLQRPIQNPILMF